MFQCQRYKPLRIRKEGYPSSTHLNKINFHGIKPNKQSILDIVSTLTTSQVPVENLLFSSNYRAEIGVFSVGKQWPSFMQTMQWDANLRKGSRHLLPPTFKTMSATFSCPKLPFNIAVFYCSAQTNPNKSNRTKVHQTQT